MKGTMKTKLHCYSIWEGTPTPEPNTRLLETNEINKVLLRNEQDYFDLVASLQDVFPDVEAYESHFEMDTYEEDTPEWELGLVRVETAKFKPDHYPCIYVVFPMETDDCRGFGGASGWFDEFIYPEDF